ncbi:MAG TPA: UDP-N-acetylmuramate dehydrogenase [Acidimicrobiales bacterium]|nr:UDP-N-acetylmuramate dehydrogenase [Acidimicrobiales bacterium]
MSANALRSAGFYVREGVPFAELTTFGVGGPCACLVELEAHERLGELLALLTEPVFVLGGGSNLLVSDGGYDGTAVRLLPCARSVATDGELAIVKVSAGEDWSSFAEWCVGEGLSGVECLSGIPGTVGATPVQNVGAYGQEVASRIRHVHVWDRATSRSKVLGAAECGFAYRDSRFKKNRRFVIVSVEFALERSRLSAPVRYEELARALGVAVGARASLGDVALAVLGLRKNKGMVLDEADPDTKSAGSFFTNPVVSLSRLADLQRISPEIPYWRQSSGDVAQQGVKLAAAWLIEQAGFTRGYTKGRAGISTKHTLALVARDGASAADIIALAAEVQEGVHARFGVRLQPEPVLLGLSI